MKSEKYLTALIIILTGVVLYVSSVPFGISFLLILITIVFLILRGKVYRRVEKFLHKKFSFLSRLSPITKKIIIVIVFLLFYLVLKEIILLILKFLGFDVQKMIVEKISGAIIKG